MSLAKLCWYLALVISYELANVVVEATEPSQVTLCRMTLQASSKTGEMLILGRRKKSGASP